MHADKTVHLFWKETDAKDIHENETRKLATHFSLGGVASRTCFVVYPSFSRKVTGSAAREAGVYANPLRSVMMYVPL